MKVKRITSLQVNASTFKVVWDKTHNGGSFSYGKNKNINIGTRYMDDNELFMVVCHEVMEIVACEVNVRLNRPDCGSDYIFVYDHRQHETMMNMFSRLVSQFIK